MRKTLILTRSRHEVLLFQDLDILLARFIHDGGLLPREIPHPAKHGFDNLAGKHFLRGVEDGVIGPASHLLAPPLLIGALRRKNLRRRVGFS